MTNAEILSKALSEWGFNVVKSILPKMNIPPQSAVGKFMYGILGINPASYNVWNELGFLAEPMIQSVVSPMVTKYVASIPDDQVKDVAYKFVDAFIGQAKEKGSVNVFGLQLGENAFTGLKDIMDKYYG